MTPSALPGLDTGVLKPTTPASVKPAAAKAEAAIKQRFEQMLWAEMLSHAGLEKALTQGGGEAASAFSRYVVEEIAKDLAEKQPLGLTGNLHSTQPDKALDTGEAAQ